jgi:Cu2+-exporting ATPase
MARASGQRPHIAALADRVARVFLAALLLLCVVAGVAWAFIDADRALPIVVSLLVVSCPCALSLATPAALAASTGALAREGVLVTRGRAIESLARLTDVVFDKTGTLTEAAPRLAGIEAHADLDEGTCLAIAAAMERGSAHPLARAIERACFARRNDGGVPRVEAATDVMVRPGLGLEASIEGTRYRIGSWRHVTDWLALSANEVPRAAPVEVMTSSVPQARVFLADETGVLACFIMATPLRAGAAEAMAAMRAQGLRIHLLSGDVVQSAQRAAAALGIEHAQGGLAPEEKLEQVRALQAGGAVVAMVGDGINDAPVLAGADVAIAMGDGSALAQVSADVVLMSDQIARLPAAMAQARRTMRVVHQNLLWAGVYNGIAIPAAAFGLVTPWIASVGMSLSSLVVVLNALRLSRR